VDHHFQIGDRLWLHISKYRFHGEGRKLKPIKYVTFTMLDQVGNDAFQVPFVDEFAPEYLNELQEVVILD